MKTEDILNSIEIARHPDGVRINYEILNYDDIIEMIQTYAREYHGNMSYNTEKHKSQSKYKIDSLEEQVALLQDTIIKMNGYTVYRRDQINPLKI